MNTKLHALSEPVRILRRLQQFGYTSAIIAGGAIRDDYAKKEINDYDIFLWDPRLSGEFKNKINPLNLQPQIDFQSESFDIDRTTEFVDLLHSLDVDQIFRSGMYGPLTGDGQKLSTPGIGANLTGVWEAQLDYYDYQLIYTQVAPIEHVEKYFDIGLCKAYCDGTKIRYTPDFLKDMKNRTFTIVGQGMTQDQFNYVVDYHIDKIEWKYPGFRIAVVPHNQSLFEVYQNS